MEEEVSVQIHPLRMFVAGGFGGTCSVLVGYPFDTVKVHLQTMPPPDPGKAPLYSGAFDCAAKIIRDHGLRGIYKGVTVPLVGAAPIYATSFFSFALGEWLQKTGDNDTTLTYPQIFIAGVFAGVFTTVITAPGERIKCVLQVQQTSDEVRQYNGLIDTARKLYKDGGLRSIFKGTYATLLRDSIPSGIYFTVYEYLKNAPKKQTGRDEVSLLSTILSGGTAGISFWFCALPADVLKNRYQSAPEGTYRHGIRSVFKQLMANEGFWALYRGIIPIMLRAFPANAVTFSGMELVNKIFQFYLPNF